MAVSLGEFIGSLPDAERAAIAARADELRAEAAALRGCTRCLAKGRTEGCGSRSEDDHPLSYPTDCWPRAR